MMSNIPQLDKNANVDQSPVNPPPMMDAEIRAIVTQMSQSMTTQAQFGIVQAQEMTTQPNWVVAPRPHQQVTSIASCLRDFTRMNPLLYMVLKLMKTPKNSLMRFTKCYMLWG